MTKRLFFLAISTLCLLFTHLSTDQNIIILLGPQGSGKETISKKLSKLTHVPSISVSRLLRSKAKEDSPHSKEINTFLSSGELVPDELTIATLLERTEQEDCSNGFIVFGFPRTLTQAKKLEEYFPQKDHIIVVNVSIGLNTLFENLQGRSMCQSCLKSYHVDIHPPKRKNKCDDCGIKLVSKTFQTLDAIQKRVDFFRAQLDPIRHFYKANYQWIDIKNDSTDECFADLLNKVESIIPNFANSQLSN